MTVFLTFQALKEGVFDVLPRNSLDTLTAEDLRLLLNGVGDIDVETLISYTSFNDESGDGASERLTSFKRWFWAIVERLTPAERQDLVSGSLVLSHSYTELLPCMFLRNAHAIVVI